MDKTQLKGYMEFTSRLPDQHLSFELKKLVEAADQTQIHAFGWPIGVVIHTEQFRPKPFQDGIRVVIDRPMGDDAFDYWTLHRDGTFYILKSLFEDRRSEGKIFLDTRVVRTAEVFLRTARLYETLGVPIDKQMSSRIEYGGLQDRVLSSANPMRIFPHSRKCAVDKIEKAFHRSIGEFLDPGGLKEVVYEVVKTIGEMCDFFVPDRLAFVDPIVDGLLQGRIL